MKLLLSALLVSLLFGAASAQGVYTGKVVVPGSVVAESLKEAERALQRKDQHRAIAIYDDILHRLADRPVPIHRTPRQRVESNPIIAGDRFAGVRSLVHKILIELPDQGLAQYLRRTEPLAKKLLEEGLRSGHAAPLREAVRRYFLSVSGQAAALVLVDRNLRDGRVEEARILAERSEEEMRAIKSPKHPLMLARVALCLAACGRRSELESLGEEIVGVSLPKLSVDGERKRLSVFVKELLSEMPPPAAEQNPAGSDLALFSRPATWSRSFKTRPRSQQEFVSWGATRVQPRRSYYPVFPLLKDAVVYACDGLRVSARSIFNGEELWPQVRAEVRSFEGRTNRNLFFELSLDRDLLFAYLEGAPQTRGQKGLWGGFDPIEAIPTRRLVAIDNTSGRVRWSHLRFQGRTREETDFIRRITVNTPPVVVGKTLYVAASYYLGGFRQWLCAFDRDTGHLIWRTYICTGQMELNMFGNPIKESVPGRVLEKDGILYYSTNVGILAAVEADTGSLRWLSAYEQVPIPHVDSQLTRERLPGWASSSPAIWKDRLFIAPSDSYDLYSVDIKTGESKRVLLARRSYQNRNAYFLGVHRDTLLVAGRLVMGIDPGSLRLKWSTLEFSQQATGSGFVKGRPSIVGDDLVFTTQNGSRVLAARIDLKTGKMEDLKTIAGPCEEGHVIMTSEAAILCGRGRMYAYFDLAAVEARLKREILRTPSDAALRLRLADIRRQKGDYRLAIETFEAALKLGRSKDHANRTASRRAQMALHTLWMELALTPERKIAGRPSKSEDRFEEALRYAPDDVQRAATLITCLQWARRENKREFFLRTAQRLIENHENLPIVCDARLKDLLPKLSIGDELPAGLLAMMSAGLQLQEWGQHRRAVEFFQMVLERFHSREFGTSTAWSYASDHIAMSIKAAGRDAVYAAQDRKAADLLRSAQKAQDPDALREILAHYPQSRHVEAAYLTLNELLLQRKAWNEALREMQTGFVRFKNVTAPILSQYVRCLEELGCIDSARQILSLLSRRYPDRRITGDGQSTTVSRWVASRLRSTLYTENRSPVEVPTGLARSWEYKAQGSNVLLVEPTGHRPASCDLWVLVYDNGSLIALDPANKAVVWRTGVGNYPVKALWHDGVLLLQYPSEAIAVDAETGATRWRFQPRDANLIDLAAGQGKAYVLIDYLYGAKQLVLAGLDLRTGANVQSRTLNNFGNAEILVDDACLMLRSFSDRRGLILDALTSERKAASFPLRRGARLKPYFNQRGLLIAPSTPYSSRGTFNLQGRQMGRETPRWEYPFKGEDVINSWAHDNYLVLYLRTRPTQRLRRSMRRIVVMDTIKGVKLCAHTIKGETSVLDAKINGRQLFLRIKRVGQRIRGTHQAVRAIELRGGARLWETIPFVGSNLDLEMRFSKKSLLLLRAPTLVTRSPRPLGANLYWFNLKTGRAKDEINLGRLPLRRQGPGFVVRPSSLAIQAGKRILFYRP